MVEEHVDSVVVKKLRERGKGAADLSIPTRDTATVTSIQFTGSCFLRFQNFLIVLQAHD